MLRGLSCLALSAALAGCTVGPNYLAPKLDTQQRFVNAVSTRIVQVPNGAWWNGFNDPVLSELIANALTQNFDVQAAILRLKQSRAVTGPVNTALFPTIDGSSSAKQSRSTPPETATSAFNYSLDASWEIDLWGGKKRTFEAANARIEETASDVNAAKLSLIAELATAYIDLRSNLARRGNVEAQIRLRRDTLGLTKSKFSAGLVAEGDVLRASASLATAQSQSPDFDTAIARNRYRIAVLSGEMPGRLDAKLGTSKLIPHFSKSPAIGVLADLARRRPDIVKLERELAASSADIGVAESDLYPKLSLLGSIGGSESKSNGLNISSPGTWSFGPSISLPIFDAGRRRAQVEAKKAKSEEALVNWKSGVLKAVEEVENGIVIYKSELNKKSALERSAASNRKVSKQSMELYEKGLSSFLEVLDAERSTFDAESAAIESDAQVSRNVVNLYKVLGSGW
jgi:outer membrane protein, multidrug efflux system